MKAKCNWASWEGGEGSREIESLGVMISRSS